MVKPHIILRGRSEQGWRRVDILHRFREIPVPVTFVRWAQLPWIINHLEKNPTIVGAVELW